MTWRPANEENAERPAKAMKALEAEVLAVPPFLLLHLHAGHAVVSAKSSSQLSARISGRHRDFLMASGTNWWK